MSLTKNMLGLTTALLCAFSLNVSAEQIEIKFSHVVTENTPKGQMALKFKTLVEERLDGQVVVKVFPNSQLFGDNKVLEAMQLGDVQLAAPSLSKFKKYTKKLQVFDLPFLFNDMAAVERFQQGEHGQKLLNSIKRKGLQGLGYLHNGMKQLSSSSEMTTPADLQGKKFRIMSSDVLAAQFHAVDAVPVKKPFSEVFTLLQTKAIDGQENTWSNIYSKKFFEVQEHITESNHGVLDYLVVTSRDFWYSMPKDIRKDVKTALDEAIAYGNEIASQKSEVDKQRIAESKRATIKELSSEERQQWVEAMKPVWKRFEKQIGKNVIDAAIAAN